MRVRTLFILACLLLVALFAALNWSAFVAVTPLSFLITTVDAPLGLVMLGLLAVVVVGFALYMAVWQSGVLMEMRRYSKELQSQRALADQAEASRFTELRSYLATELERLHARMAETEVAVQRDVNASGNTLAAYIGEVEDRLERKGVQG